jgi:hypothetical protein
VREPLVLTGNPWKNPAAMLAAPMPIISRSPLTSWPARAANAEEVEIVSVSETTAIPTAPATSRARSDRGRLGTVRGGNPWGRGPTRETPWSARLKALAARIETTTATSTAGSLGTSRWRPAMRTRPSRPIASAAATVSPLDSPLAKPVASGISPSASTEKPNSLGSWPIRIVRASPFM